MFGLTSRVTFSRGAYNGGAYKEVGASFVFSGVHEVKVKNGLDSVTTDCSIALPTAARLRLKDGNFLPVTLGDLIADGDGVRVELGYDGVLRTEFEGFVKRRVVDKMLLLECEGYERVLRLGVKMTGNYKSTTLKGLLTDMLKGTGIGLSCSVDFPLVGMQMDGANGLQVIDHIKRVSEGAIGVFFIEPKTLWAGLIYTPYVNGVDLFKLPTASYRLGYNCPLENGLKKKVVSEPVSVLINGKLVSGDLVRTEAKDKTAKRQVKYFLNNVPDAAMLAEFASEKQRRLNYEGFEGFLMGFGVPYCAPGYRVNVIDNRYADASGTYLCEGIEVTFGLNGFRRRVNIGLKV